MNQILPEEPHYKHWGEHKQSNETSEKLNKFIKSPLGKWAVGILVTIGVVGGGMFAIDKFNNNNQPQLVEIETPTTPAETPQVTIETTPTAEVLPTVKSLEMDGSLISKPEELAKTFEDDRSTAWFNAGATPENANAALASGDIPSYATKIASQYDQIYIDALFIKNWQSIPSLVEEVDRTKDIHKSTLELYFATSFRNMHVEDKEPYRRGSTVTKIDSVYTPKIVDASKPALVSITTTQHDYDNSNKNRVGGEQFGGGVTGQDNHPTLSFETDGSKIKLSSVIFN